VKSDSTLEEDVGVVIAAGGRGERFGTSRNKLLAPLDGLPLVCHCLRTFAEIVPAEQVVLVVPDELRLRFATCIRDAGISGKIHIIAGGESRQDSVTAGLLALPLQAHIIAVHDAARPYTSTSLIRRCIASARKRGAGVAARRVTDTIKVAEPDGRVLETKDRSVLWAAETPQVFTHAVIAQAYAHVRQLGISITDEAQAVEVLGESVFLVEHTEGNSKVTYATDLPHATP